MSLFKTFTSEKLFNSTSKRQHLDMSSIFNSKILVVFDTLDMNDIIQSDNGCSHVPCNLSLFLLPCKTDIFLNH